MARPGDRFRKRDVLVVFDIRRYQEDVVHLAEEASERAATIVLFTDQWLSPIARHAKHVISARIAVPSNWDSNAAIFAVIEAMIASATKELWDVAEARMKALEECGASRSDDGPSPPPYSSRKGEED